MALDRCQSLGVGQSRPMASAFARGWAAAADFGLLGPGDRSKWGTPRTPASCEALARPVQLPTLGLSALGLPGL